MAQAYYTAKEAREILGMTHSALLNQVTAGNLQRIIPPGKRQGVYLKEEVDQLRREMDTWLLARRATKPEPTHFVRATIEDLPAAVALADSVFDGRRTIPVEKRIEWLQKNPDIDYLLKQDEHIVGYLTLVPLSPQTIDDLLNQRRFARDLTAADILPYVPGTPVDIYGMAIGVFPGVSRNQKREWGARLIMGARSVIIGLGERGISIRSFKTHSTKPDGIRLMRHLGFTETTSNVPGMRDFVIDVASSGLPFLAEYKDALRRWQAQHPQSASQQNVKDPRSGKPAVK